MAHGLKFVDAYSSKKPLIEGLTCLVLTGLCCCTQGSLERTLVNFAGKGAFIAPLSAYPVHYADSDFVIFEFTTLRTKIAARRIDSAT